MKLKAQLSGTDHQISLSLASQGAAVEVDGRHYYLEVRQLAHGEYLLISGSNVYKCRVEAKRDSQNSFAVVLRGLAHDITIIDPKRLRGAPSAGAHHAGTAQIISPMPGKIVRVLVEVGAQVETGAGIVVVEAMKMQNEMKSPKAGVVVSINAETGATVNAGDVLAVIE
ncbi:MAG: acetyl-CoA carboxylase biotin carboxyl carrier protein subunit [Acidobacteriota bacterium]|nr:acetyl-CoA carboxylase biotin carboxyl carrier protein subunit [Acidobacteriota bacterium]